MPTGTAGLHGARGHSPVVDLELVPAAHVRVREDVDGGDGLVRQLDRKDVFA